MDDQKQSGLTLMELMMVVAIMAIAATVAIFGAQQIQSAHQGSAFMTGKEILRNWAVMALSDEGAELTIQSFPDSSIWTVNSLGGNPITQTYHLPAGVALSLNGTSVNCAAMDPEGFITPITGCTTSIPSGTLPEWEITLDGQHENL